MKQRNISLDIIRIFACLMVIACHSPMACQDPHSLAHAAVSLFTSPCNVLFFMVSGALLLPAPNNQKVIPIRIFLKKRLSKVLVPTLVWTVFYIVVHCIERSDPASEILRSVLSIPFSPQGSGVLWFMYALIGLYLLTPILSAWLQRASEKEERFYLMLWCVTLFYPLVEGYLKIVHTEAGILYSFSGYVGYYVLGHYLLHYGQKIRLWHAALLELFALATPLATRLLHLPIGSGLFTDCFSVFVLAQGVFWWTALRSLTARLPRLQRWQNGLARLSGLTFGIYLMHIFFMRSILWHVPFIAALPAVQQIVVTIILTFAISLAVAWLISLTPVGNHVIGYKQKNSSIK